MRSLKSLNREEDLFFFFYFIFPSCVSQTAAKISFFSMLGCLRVRVIIEIYYVPGSAISAAGARLQMPQYSRIDFIFLRFCQ